MNGIATLGEVLIRLTPPGYKRLKETDTFTRSVGGAEINVSVALAQFGHDIQLLTAVPPTDIGENVKKFLRGNRINTDYLKVTAGRLGLYFVEEGFGIRRSSVTYDRAYSSFTNLKRIDFDWDNIFEDCQLFYVSGITPALSSDLKEVTIEACEEASKRGIQVAFDCNYRSKLWSTTEAKEAFESILPYVDICFGGLKDFVYILEIGEDASFTRENMIDLFKKTSERYSIEVFACTERRVLNSQNHQFQGFLFTEGELYSTSKVDLQILDRIGGGDSFAAGVVHGILNGMGMQQTLEFGFASSMLKQTVRGDHFSFTEQDVNNWLDEQISDVQR